MSTYENPWYYQGKPVESEDLDGWYSFVYQITNLENNKKYIGKKLLWFKKAKQVNKKKKRFLVESDWKDYYGSNDELKADVEKLGVSKFHREILRFCKNKAESSYWEAKLQFETDCILSEDYYNSWIMVKVRKSPALIKSLKE